MPVLPCTHAKINGNRNKAAKVLAMSPPITARPRGAAWSPPSPKPEAIGIIPTTIATLVIRIGRIREAAASRAADNAFPEWLRNSSAFVTSSTELEIETPTDMIIPI